jgi:Cof subfamily protein (haloacid dehalogenase superfamily)
VTTAVLPDGVRPGGRFDAWAVPRPAYVVCDVDGTLIGPEHGATDEVVAAVGRARSAGLRVGIASGRMGGAIVDLRHQLGSDGPDVVFNGGEIRDGDASVRAWSLTGEQVDGLLDLLAPRDDAYLEIYPSDGFHVSRWDERARPHWDLLGREPLGVLARAADLADGPVLKATIAVFDPAAVSDIAAAVRGLGLVADGGAGSPRTPDLVYVNATHPQADKGRALAAAAAHLELGLDEVVAIGDAGNDLSMLAVAGTAIAMGQAPEEIRAAAHLVVPSVDAHGVAAALDACVTWRSG